MRNITAHAALPPNPTYREFERSDGKASQRPAVTTRVVDEDGNVNYHQFVGLDEPASIKWRVGIGDALGKALDWPKGPGYVLADWPSHYALYDHNKGAQAAPRHDLYLFGGPARFRSVPEFVPHAIWLFSDPTMNPANCECKYCSKKPQREITATMSQKNILSPGLSPSRSSPSVRHPRRRTGPPRSHLREQKIYASVQKASPLKPGPHITPEYSMLVERNQDLRAVNSVTEMHLKRWYREGELVWCRLEKPILGPHGINDAIQFWPGVVEEVKLKSKPESRPASSNPSSQATSRNGAGPTSNGQSTDSMPSWTVRQSTSYKIKLVVVPQTSIFPDNRVLPYQAYVPSADLLATLTGVPLDVLNFDRAHISAFQPIASKGSSPPPFAAAVSPYALALQMGVALSGFWSLTDEWEFKQTIPQPPAPSFRRPGDLTTLPQALMSAGTHNAAALTSTHDAGSISSGPSSQNRRYYEVNGPRDDMPSDELSQLADKMLGVVPTAHIVTQTRYQGLWWGAERIWTDDFVRLKVPRRSLAPKGAKNILPPSGPGKAVQASSLARGKDSSDLGAGQRGTFMRLEALFIVDTHNEAGKPIKECRATGKLYELADKDWEDPEVTKAEKVAVDEEAAMSQSASQGPTSMPWPAPLKPLPLPNVDPSASVSSSTSNVISQMNAPNTPKRASPNSQLSQPDPSTHYLLPEAPDGYRFRPILEEGYEVVVSMALVSGRYYPKILSHPLMEDAVTEALAFAQEEAGGMKASSQLWSLEGLSAGYSNSVDPTVFKATRLQMLTEADRLCRMQLEAHLENALLKEEQGTGMEVDTDELNGMEVDS